MDTEKFVVCEQCAKSERTTGRKFLAPRICDFCGGHFTAGEMYEVEVPVVNLGPAIEAARDQDRLNAGGLSDEDVHDTLAAMGF